MIKYPFLWLIRLYQKTFSPDHGPLQKLFPGGYCRFYPTCSEYGHQSIKRFGLLKGGWLTTKRICKCYPWHPGGVDEVPQKKS